MGYFKTMEIEKMENERLKERTQEPTMREIRHPDEQMRLVARRFLIALCDARISGQESIKNRLADQMIREKVFEEFNQFSEEDWVEFKKVCAFYHIVYKAS